MLQRGGVDGLREEMGLSFGELRGEISGLTAQLSTILAQAAPLLELASATVLADQQQRTAAPPPSRPLSPSPAAIPRLGSADVRGSPRNAGSFYHGGI